MYPRSGFWRRNTKTHSFLLPGQHCRERLLGGNFGTVEHLPKPPFWKPPFCEPLKDRQVADLDATDLVFLGPRISAWLMLCGEASRILLSAF